MAASDLQETINKFNVVFGGNAAGVKQWGDQFMVAKLAAGLMVAGAALVAFGLPMKALAGTVGLVSMAVKGLSGAMTLLAAHPVVAVIVGIGIAAGAAAVALNRWARSTAELTHQMRGQREEGDKLRALARQRAARLQELAEKQQLSSAEMKEAQGLIEALEAQYGQLGVRLDQTAGKLINVAEAMGRLNGATRAEAVAQLNREIAEAERNLHAVYQAEARARGEQFGEGWWEQAKTLAASPITLFRGAGDIGQLGEERAELLRQIHAAQRRLAALRGGSAAETGPQGEALAAAQSRVAQGVAEEEQQWARRVEQLKLQQIEDRFAREKALIDERYAHERKQAEAAAASQATLDAIGRARRLELAALETEQTEQRQRESLAAASRQGAILDEITRLEIQQRHTGAAREMALLDLQQSQALGGLMPGSEQGGLVREEFDLRRALLGRDATAGIQEEIERLEIELGSEGGDRELALLQRERAKVLAELAGVVDPELVNRRFDLQIQQIQRGAAEAAQQQRLQRTSTVGTFDPLAAGRMGTGSVAERTAKAAEKTAQNTHEIRRELRLCFT